MDTYPLVCAVYVADVTLVGTYANEETSTNCAEYMITILIFVNITNTFISNV